MSSSTRALLVVLVVAAVVRAISWADFRETPFAARAIEDEEFYDAWAQRILEGQPDPDVYHMSPLPAYVLALEYRVLGRSFDRVRLAGALAGLLSVLLAFLLTREAFGPGAGVLSAATLAIFAPAVFYESSLLPLAHSLTVTLGAAWAAVAANGALAAATVAAVPGAAEAAASTTTSRTFASE